MFFVSPCIHTLVATRWQQDSLQFSSQNQVDGCPIQNRGGPPVWENQSPKGVQPPDMCLLYLLIIQSDLMVIEIESCICFIREINTFQRNPSHHFALSNALICLIHNSRRKLLNVHQGCSRSFTAFLYIFCAALFHVQPKLPEAAEEVALEKIR